MLSPNSYMPGNLIRYAGGEELDHFCQTLHQDIVLGSGLQSGMPEVRFPVNFHGPKLTSAVRPTLMVLLAKPQIVQAYPGLGERAIKQALAGDPELTDPYAAVFNEVELHTNRNTAHLVLQMSAASRKSARAEQRALCSAIDNAASTGGIPQQSPWEDTSVPDLTIAYFPKVKTFGQKEASPRLQAAALATAQKLLPLTVELSPLLYVTPAKLQVQ